MLLMGDILWPGHTSSFGAGVSDAWVVKVGIEGNSQWNYTYGGTDSDVAISIISTPDGGYALTGVTESFGLGGMDMWVIKIDSTGQHQWNRTYGGSQNDYGGSQLWLLMEVTLFVDILKVLGLENEISM